MDWLERYFGLNPDGGDGSIEWAICSVGVALVISGGLVVMPRVRSRITAAGRRVAYRVSALIQGR
jgi:hypothetical protein